MAGDPTRWGFLCPGCDDTITDRYLDYGVCGNCYGTTDDPHLAERSTGELERRTFDLPGGRRIKLMRIEFDDSGAGYEATEMEITLKGRDVTVILPAEEVEDTLGDAPEWTL